jgi:hypothetical protein
MQGFCQNPLMCVDAIHHRARDITKSETPVPNHPNYSIMYPKDATVRPVKISPVHKILLTGLCAESTAL